MKVKLFVYLDQSWKNMTSNKLPLSAKIAFLRKLQKAKWIKITKNMISLYFAAQNVFSNFRCIPMAHRIKGNNTPQMDFFEGKKLLRLGVSQGTTEIPVAS